MLILVAIVLGATYVLPTDSADIPPSHISVLDELLEKYLNKTSVSQNSIVNLLLGEVNTSAGDIARDLDVNILDHKTLKKIIEAETERRRRIFMASIPSRRYETPALVMRDKTRTDIIKKLFELMKQSIYTARYRLAETKAYRRKFKDDIPFNIGIIVANVYQLVLKCEHLHNQMYKYSYGVFFLWRLLIYERILACHTDVEDLVRRAFMYQAEFDETFSAGNDEENNQPTTPDINSILNAPQKNG